jgi:AcrR family transcriptional regulator
VALTHEEVINAAVGLLRQHGLADLTMRRLSRELGVQPGALYWHVDNKQTLLIRVAERMLADVAVPRSGETLSDIRRLSQRIRAAVLPVPDGSDVVALSYALDPTSIPAFVQLRTLVGEQCDSAAATTAATDLIVHHLLGSVGAEQDRRLADLPSRGATRAFERGLDLALASLTTSPQQRSAHGV